MTAPEICVDLPDLTPDDVTEALRYAAETVRERSIPLRPSHSGHAESGGWRTRVGESFRP
jgi:hypothetical protein